MSTGFWCGCADDDEDDDHVDGDLIVSSGQVTKPKTLKRIQPTTTLIHAYTHPKIARLLVNIGVYFNQMCASAVIWFYRMSVSVFVCVLFAFNGLSIKPLRLACVCLHRRCGIMWLAFQVRSDGRKCTQSGQIVDTSIGTKRLHGEQNEQWSFCM